MTIAYTTTCSTEKLSDIRSFVQEQLQQVPLSDLEKKQVVLAVDEACANAIIHGNRCDASRSLHLALDIEPQQINIEISDIGSFRPNETNWRSRSINDQIRQRSKGGLGLRLMHSIMDKVSYYNRGQVNVCSLSKQLK
jgi:serine/threonine-protein kinase RsbW